jgi:hypothetical protein
MEGEQAEHRTRQGSHGGTRSKPDEHAVITTLPVAQTLTVKQKWLQLVGIARDGRFRSRLVCKLDVH